jgi:hypothetical protein
MRLSQKVQHVPRSILGQETFVGMRSSRSFGRGGEQQQALSAREIEDAATLQPMLMMMTPARCSTKRNGEVEAYAACTHEGIIRYNNSPMRQQVQRRPRVYRAQHP